jgi:diguanylate cyclase (GGDEF)-like protein
MEAESPPTGALVVEDSRTQLTRQRRTLGSAGFEVATAVDGREAVDALAAAAYDLVLSDVLMPRMTGYELCCHIKGDPRLEDTAVILLTSLGQPTDIIRGLECGADGFVNKPYEDDYLLGRIRGVLASRRLRRTQAGGVEILFMGERFRIDSDKPQILDFLAATFEDFVRASRREHASVLAQLRYRHEVEARRIREESLLRESEGLREARRFLQSTLDALTSQIAILDEEGRILAVNAAWDRDEGSIPLVGTGFGVGMNYLEACGAVLGGGPHRAAAIAEGVRAVLAGRRCEYHLEGPCPAPNEGRWFSLRATPFRGPGPSRVVVAHEDITPRKAAEERLHHAANQDALTGLPNRVLFADRLQCAVERARRHRTQRFAVLFLDLDNFKIINDSLGHQAGDRLLVAIARRLETIPRRTDSIARLGGDEFAVLAEEIRDAEDAVRLACRIHEVFRAPFPIDGHAVFATASIGIALGGADHGPSSDPLCDADTAMYRAKTTGPGRHAVFDSAMHTHTLDRLNLESDLRAALERDDLRVHYQPIVSLATGRIEGLEALARWEHPTRGPVSPSTFIPIAEETGAILPLGRWVLREACRQMQAWLAGLPEDSPLVMSVNLSARQFAQPDVVEQVDQTLRETGLDPSRLKLEVTESAAMRDAEAAIAVLIRLKELGIRLSLDDFGTGY